MTDLSEEELQSLYAWIDEIPLSRQKKNITRDFGDGVMAAEVIHHFLPKLVDIHNYSPANATPQKLDNWRTLNRKAFSRLNFNVPEDILQGVAAGKPGVIEFILTNLRTKIERYLENRAKNPNSEVNFGPPSQVYYDPNLLVTAYDNSQQAVWHQDPIRHSGPAAISQNVPNHQLFHRPPNAMTGTYPQNALMDASNRKQNPILEQHTFPTENVSKIPVPTGVHTLHTTKDLSNAIQHKNSMSAPSRTSILPPIRPPQHRGGNTHQGDSRSHSNPEKKNRYALHSKPTVQNKSKRDSSAGIQIKLAERDQRILESQEHIQFLQMKVTRLEHLVQIKDMKINEMKRQVDMLQLARHHGQMQHPLQRR